VQVGIGGGSLVYDDAEGRKQKLKKASCSSMSRRWTVHIVI
jgi:hypothetical protein